MLVLLPCGRLAVALALILVLDSSVQGKPLDSGAPIIFSVGLGATRVIILTQRYRWVTLWESKRRRIVVTELLHVSLVKFDSRKN